MKYRKKPVIVEAMQYPGMRELNDATKVLAWLDEHGVIHRHDAGLIIVTLEGNMQADPGDWIIKGVKGEFYPCKPDIFEATYEPVHEAILLPERMEGHLAMRGIHYVETNERVAAIESDLITRFRSRAERRKGKLNAQRLAPFYRWEVVCEDERWAVIAMQNVAKAV